MSDAAAARPGYRQQVIDLALQGIAPADIHRRLNGAVKKGSIKAWLSMARAEGVPIRKFPNTGARRGLREGIVARCVVWKDPDFTRLKEAARARGVSPTVLMQRILDAVLDGDLIDAVLDDGGGR
jgi:hypothetical protein